MAAIGLDEGVVTALSFQSGEEEVAETVGAMLCERPFFMGAAGRNRRGATSATFFAARRGAHARSVVAGH
jgi:hypothetical protein